MPVSLHHHFRHGLDFEPIHTDPNDQLDDPDDEQPNTHERVAKRRRIEAIATQCIRGKTPVLLSTCLRGSLRASWKNPWAGKAQNGRRELQERRGHIRRRSSKQPTGIHALEETATRPEEAPIGLPTTIRTRRQERNQDHTSTMQPAQPAERALEQDKDDTANAGGPTTISVIEKNQPSATEYTNANTQTGEKISSRHQRVSVQSLEAHLSKDEGEVEDAVLFSTPVANDRAPFTADLPVSVAQNTTPVVPGGSYPANTDMDGSSSASASMMISSQPERNANHNGNGVRSRGTLEAGGRTQPANGLAYSPEEDGLKNELDLSIHPGKPSHTPLQRNLGYDVSELSSKHSIPHRRGTTTKILAKHGTHTPDTEPASSPTSIFDGIQSARRLARLAADKAFAEAKIQQPPSKGDVRGFAERRGMRSPTQATTKSKKAKAKDKASRRDRSQYSPTSSTSFIYHRGGRRDAEQATKRSELGPLTLNSSPFTRGDNGTPGQSPSLHDSDHVGNTRSQRRDVYEVTEAGAGSSEQERLRRSRQSDYSTQAAMMLARMEFQEATLLGQSLETPRGSHVQGETHEETLHHCDAAITPFHAFNAELDKRHPPDSISRESPISTQDLFTAASPFAFSAIKKSVRPLRSSLRFSVLPGEDRERADHNIHKSPPSSPERMPLKERNSRVSFRSTASATEKGSQESPLPTAVSLSEADEVPKLVFEALLGDVDHSHADVEFTGQYLRNPGGVI